MLLALATQLVLIATSLGDKPWSFAPVSHPAVPSGDWGSGNPIDAFIGTRCAAEGIEPLGSASDGSCYRRLSLDLTGLPPTAAEISEVTEGSDGAALSPEEWGRLVDRLMASPRFGEHQARFWLDAVRYADTHGFHFDNERSIWKYRDWVVDAINSNMPFDRFTLEQLAGDLIPDATDQTRIASGFIRCNPTTNEGGSIDDEVMFRNAADRVDTYATVWLGLTMHCAQCHEHKYDPIDQQDYYSLYAFFNSTKEASMDGNLVDPEPVLRIASESDRAELARVRDGIAAGRARLDALQREVGSAPSGWQSAETEVARSRWFPLVDGQLKSESGVTLATSGGAIVASGASPAADTYELSFAAPTAPMLALRLDLDIAPEGIGPGRSPNGNFVVTEIEAFVQAPDGTRAPVRIGRAAATREQQGFPVANAIDGVTNHDNGWAGLDAQRVPGPATAVFRFDQPLTIGSDSKLVIRLACRSMYAQHTLGRFRLAVRTDAQTPKLEMTPWRQSKPLPGADRQQAYSTDVAASGIAREAELSAGLELKEVTVPEGQVVEVQFGQVASVFAVRKIISDRPVNIQALVNHDDALKVFVNGKLVSEKNVDQAVTAPGTPVTIPLEAGENLLVLKIVNGGGQFAWAFRLEGEFPDPSEARIHGLLAQGASGAVPAATAEPAAAAMPAAAAAEVTNWYVQRVDPTGRVSSERVAQASARLAELESGLPPSLIAQELPSPRETRVLMRGQYDKPGDLVKRGTPRGLVPMAADMPLDRRGLAAWTTHPDNPLPARVLVNRVWQQYFGSGLVRTAEDFGTRGDTPSHPELLDWLASDLVANGWDMKRLHRMIVTSDAYRRSFAATPEMRERDPENRLLARGARHRLDAEVLRDQALYAGGILVERLGGRGVLPYQPEGVWEAVAFVGSNTQFYKRGSGDDLHRRSLYTFYKRTAPPASMVAFDAPSREASCVKRERTNTPLQALVTMNDEQFVESSRALAQRALQMTEVDGDPGRLDFIFLSLTARVPGEVERAELMAFLSAARQSFSQDPSRALLLLALGASGRDEGLDPVEHAAWTMLSNLVLNLDETMNNG